MRSKLALEISYLGTRYIGWQSQPAEDCPSVYEVVHEALVAVGINSGPVAAGRTDKGTHAMSTWITVSERRPAADCQDRERNTELAMLRDDLNKHLPVDVRVVRVVDAPLAAHAMTGSEGKTYTYFVLCCDNDAAVAPWLTDACFIVHRHLDSDAMRAALGALRGEHDFRALCAVQDPRRSTSRTITHASMRVCTHMRFPFLGCFIAAAAGASEATDRCTVSRGSTGSSRSDEVQSSTPEAMWDGCEEARGGPTLLQLRFTGDGFLKHQVRRIVGLLIRIGRSEEPPAALAEALASPATFDRGRVLEAPSCGLWLESVDVAAMLGASASETERAADGRGAGSGAAAAASGVTYLQPLAPPAPPPPPAERPHSIVKPQRPKYNPHAVPPTEDDEPSVG